MLGDLGSKDDALAKEDAASVEEQDSVVEDAASVEEQDSVVEDSWEQCSNVADEAPMQEAQNPNVEYYVVSTPRWPKEEEQSAEVTARTSCSALQAPKEEDESPAEEQQEGAPTKKQPDPDIDLKRT